MKILKRVGLTVGGYLIGGMLAVFLAFTLLSVIAFFYYLFFGVRWNPFLFFTETYRYIAHIGALISAILVWIYSPR